MDIDDYFRTGPPWERPIYEVVVAHLDSLGGVYIEPVSVGIFFKSTRKVCELRPKAKWSALSFSLPERIDSTRMSRKPIQHGKKWFHVVNLRSPAEFDDKVKDWVTQAYLLATD